MVQLKKLIFLPYCLLLFVVSFSGSSDDATDKSTAPSSFSATDVSLNGNRNCNGRLEQTSFELCQQVSVSLLYLFSTYLIQYIQ